MRRGTSTGRPTVAQAARFARMIELGCIACRMNAESGTPTLRPYAPKLDIHHLTNGARRLGHDQTLCLCQFHHKGDWWPFPDKGYSQMLEIYGPAYHRSKRVFFDVYGGDAEMLAYQNALLGDAQ